MSDENTIDYQVLKSLLLNLVTVPEDLKIDRKIDEQGVLLSVTVSSKDMGIVIGKNGSMATSIKTVIRAIGKSNKMNVRVQFLEPDGSSRVVDKNNNKFNTTKKLDDNISSNSLEDDLKEFAIN